jgi:hypothetical protein
MHISRGLPQRIGTTAVIVGLAVTAFDASPTAASAGVELRPYRAELAQFRTPTPRPTTSPPAGPDAITRFARYSPYGLQGALPMALAGNNDRQRFEERKPPFWK